MTFGYPVVLALLLVGLPLTIWSLVRQNRRQRDQLQAFGQPDILSRASAIPPDRSRRMHHLLRLVALGLGVVALSRPQFGERASSRAASGRDLLVLLDLSRSMNAVDADPLGSSQGRLSRLAVAKHAVAEVLAASPEDRVGLVIFGGSAFLQLPLTRDHAAFHRFLDAASTDDLADPATDLGSALSTAAATFEHEGERGYQSVLLVSDGESVEGDIGPALARLRRTRIPVFTIGVGSIGGAPLPADSSEAPEKWHRDHIGRIVESRLDEGDIRRVARETNGSYVRWSTEAGRALGVELARAERRTTSSRGTAERADRFQWPLGLAVIVFALEPMIGLGARRRRA
jgi:Ca-activated chloride channel homolog